jgi:hypothetical protein
MKFINNQTAVLPALKEIVDNKISDQNANSKNHFQYDLLLDRMNRSRESNTRVAGGIDSVPQTVSTFRRNQIFNDQALMQGVTVKKNFSKRKASMQNQRASTLEFGQNLRITIKKDEQLTLRKRSTILDLEKNP